jgi:hypothetical protein
LQCPRIYRHLLDPSSCEEAKLAAMAHAAPLVHLER